MKLCFRSSSSLSSYSFSNQLIYVAIVFWCSSLLFVNGDENQQQQTVDNEEATNYGERLAESSYSFTNAFQREPKEESSIYSSGINAIMNSDGFLNQMEKYGGHDGKYSPQGPVEMAVHSKKTVEVIPVKFEDNDNGEPQVIEISPYEVPVSIVFKTQTNKLHVNQEHKTEPAEEVKEINSEEEPQRVVHNVYRPVIQEVTEVVQPYRKVIQKVEPVIEEMKTIISKAAPHDGSAAQHNSQQSKTSIGQMGQSFFGNSGFKGFGSSGSSQSIGGSGHSSGGYESTHNSNSKLGRFSDFPMAQIPYGSEVVNKLAAPPSISTTTNGNYVNTITNSMASSSNIRSNFGSNVGPLSSISNSSITHVSKLEPMVFDKDNNYQYNDIIKQYIDNILNIKSDNKQQKSLASNAGINANSIKFTNLPMKYIPTTAKLQSSLKPNESENNGNGNGDDKNKKFKIIKEFRISLNDIKKELGKVTPTVSTSASGVANSANMMMRPFASFSVSGANPAQFRHQTLQDISNKIMNQQQPRNAEQTSIKRSSRKPEVPEKLSEFSRRSRRNMNNLSNSNSNININPLRNYHYMNLKRYGDAPPLPPPINGPISSSSSSRRDSARFRRRMLNNDNDAEGSEQHYNLYSMNLNRPRKLVRRYGIMY